MIRRINTLVVMVILLILNMSSLSHSNSQMELISIAKNKLEEMIKLYEQRNLIELMENVAEDYTNEKSLLDDKIRAEFSKYFNIRLVYSISNIAVDNQNRRVSITINYTKSAIDIKTSKPIKSKGQATFIFKVIDGKAFLYSIRGKNPFVSQ